MSKVAGPESVPSILGAPEALPSFLSQVSAAAHNGAPRSLRERDKLQLLESLFDVPPQHRARRCVELAALLAETWELARRRESRQQLERIDRLDTSTTFTWVASFDGVGVWVSSENDAASTFIDAQHLAALVRAMTRRTKADALIGSALTISRRPGRPESYALHAKDHTWHIDGRDRAQVVAALTRAVTLSREWMGKPAPAARTATPHSAARLWFDSKGNLWAAPASSRGTSHDARRRRRPAALTSPASTVEARES